MNGNLIIFKLMLAHPWFPYLGEEVISSHYGYVSFGTEYKILISRKYYTYTQNLPIDRTPASCFRNLLV